MKRRKLLTALGIFAVGGPLASFAQQQAKVWRVGFLSSLRHPDSLDADFYGAFRGRLRELGYVEGKNLVLEWRFAEAKAERLSELAAEFVRLNVDLIVAAGTQATGAAQKATATIPIVMGPVGDPVGSGFVKSLAKPGGNITGVSNMAGEIGPKHFEMMLSIVPKLSRVAVLVTPTNSSHLGILRSIQAAAQKVGVTILPAEARNPQQIEQAFSMMAQENAGSVIVAADQLFLQQRHQVAALATKYRMASIIVNREYPEAGGLMSYGHNVHELYRRAANYVDKILNGARPGDLPIEQPTKFELVVNLKTAKIIGVSLPQSLLLRADEVIQ